MENEKFGKYTYSTYSFSHQIMVTYGVADMCTLKLLGEFEIAVEVSLHVYWRELLNKLCETMKVEFYVMQLQDLCFKNSQKNFLV